MTWLWGFVKAFVFFCKFLSAHSSVALSMLINYHQQYRRWQSHLQELQTSNSSHMFLDEGQFPISLELDRCPRPHFSSTNVPYSLQLTFFFSISFLISFIYFEVGEWGVGFLAMNENHFHDIHLAQSLRFVLLYIWASLKSRQFQNTSH